MITNWVYLDKTPAYGKLYRHRTRDVVMVVYAHKHKLFKRRRKGFEHREPLPAFYVTCLTRTN